MTTTEKLLHLKEIIARAFIQASDKGMTRGLSFKYKSEPVEEENFKGWQVQIIVGEMGYGERTIQEFRFVRPHGADAKHMEYLVLSEIIGDLAFGALDTWYEVAKMLSGDKELQKEIINETKKGNISSN
jgi:hypothetical protein